MKNLALISLVAVIVFVSGCGSVSGIMPTKPHTLLELAAYDKVIVMDFNNGTDNKQPEKVQMAGNTFADGIAIQIKTAKLFNYVSREQAQGKAVVIGGTITKYEEGNSAMRFLVGFGAGSSYFDADVTFKDNETSEQLATLKIDKNSWVLGGGIASTQTVETFMDEAAKKVTQELDKIKAPKQK